MAAALKTTQAAKSAAGVCSATRSDQQRDRRDARQGQKVGQVGQHVAALHPIWPVGDEAGAAGRSAQQPGAAGAEEGEGGEEQDGAEGGGLQGGAEDVAKDGIARVRHERLLALTCFRRVGAYDSHCIAELTGAKPAACWRARRWIWRDAGCGADDGLQRAGLGAGLGAVLCAPGRGGELLPAGPWLG